MTADTPLIFHGDELSPDLRPIVMTLKLENTKLIPMDPTVLPPGSGKKAAATQTAQTQPTQTQPTEKKQSHGFFSKVGAFFASIFH